MNRIAPGEYEHEGFAISKDEYESKLWWVRRDGEEFAGDFETLGQAKEWIDQQRRA